MNTIDGVLEQKGRILIISTNYKEKLDNALLRPGRLDMKIEFTKCTNDMIHNILRNFYNAEVDSNIKFQENEITPAELVDLCFNSSGDMHNVISELLNKVEISTI